MKQTNTVVNSNKFEPVGGHVSALLGLLARLKISGELRPRRVMTHFSSLFPEFAGASPFRL